MTDRERNFYLLLCMSGRTAEATAYRERLESKEADENVREEDKAVQDNGCSQKAGKRGKAVRG